MITFGRIRSSMWTKRKFSSERAIPCSTSSQQHLTFETLLSEENKVRVLRKLKHVPSVRSTQEVPLKPGHSFAAVLVPLCTVNGEPSLLYTLRSSRLKQHRGQVSFPGGNCDDSDKDFTHTALRETYEEIGMEPELFNVWGEMTPLPSSEGRRFVYPVVAQTGEVNVQKLRLAVDEVEEAFTVPIRHLCHHANVGTTRFRSDTDFTLPVYTGAAHRIWGLTAIYTHQILTILAPGLYSLKIKHKKRLHHVHPHQGQGHWNHFKHRNKQEDEKS